ncbi:hypothetical protein AK34_3450 [Burkholderia dolosa AU0158]|nr:hypothetical protein AK34_3450 [Burkholderia dolosa AU0158]
MRRQSEGHAGLPLPGAFSDADATRVASPRRRIVLPQ